MRTIARLATALAFICAMWAPLGAYAQPLHARASTAMPSIAAIRIPNVSPMATLVNQAGTRALLVVRSKTIDFLCYDLQTGKQSHRTSITHTSRDWVYGAAATLDEQRQRAYIVMNVPRKIASVLYALDFQTGAIRATYHIDLLNLGARPVVDERTGNVWLVGINANHAYLVRIRPQMPAGGITETDLAAAGARGDSEFLPNALSIDGAAHRVIVQWDVSQRKFAGFDLTSARLLWRAQPRQSTLLVDPVLDTINGDFWVANVIDTTIYVIHTATGALRKVLVGGSKQYSVERLSFSPASGIIVAVSGKDGTELVSVSPAGKLHTLAGIKLRTMARIVTQLAGTDQSDYVYGEQIAAGMLRYYYLSFQLEGQLHSPHITTGSVLSVLDWTTGAVISQRLLPIQGEIAQGHEGQIQNGFYVTLGLGTRSLDTLLWPGAALLVVRYS